MCKIMSHGDEKSSLLFTKICYRDTLFLIHQPYIFLQQGDYMALTKQRLAEIQREIVVYYNNNVNKGKYKLIAQFVIMGIKRNRSRSEVRAILNELGISREEFDEFYKTISAP